jgi:hypothetical protein
MIGAGISGCADSRFAADNTQASRTASESCSIAMTYEWDDTRGSDTPAGAVADILESFTKAQQSLPSDAPRNTIDSMTDPVRLRVAVRGLDALMLEAQDTVVSHETGPTAIEAKTPEGMPLAYALVFEAAGGGVQEAKIPTHAKNEADDQFAIVHALLTPSFDIRGVIPAHFGTRAEFERIGREYLEWVLGARPIDPDLPVLATVTPPATWRERTAVSAVSCFVDDPAGRQQGPMCVPGKS